MTAFNCLASLKKIGFYSLLIFIISACATNIAGRKQIMLVSEKSAINASKQAYIETLKPYGDEGKLDNNVTTVKRVNSITDKLIAQAIKLRPETKDWQWSVKVLDDPDTVNAWCMAGGKMAIYTGLIEQLDATDDEIAQVMGHEIAHALANHSAERMSVAMANNLTLQLIKSSGKASEEGLGLTAMAAKVAITLPNSRTSESEADDIGVKLAAMAGYHPEAAVTLWQKMGALSAAVPEFLSTHPSPKNRQKSLKKKVKKMLPIYQKAIS